MQNGLISTILHRYLTICSRPTNAHPEVCKIRTIFQMNGCPQTYIDNAINGFFNNIHGPRTKIATNARNVSVL